MIISRRLVFAVPWVEIVVTSRVCTNRPARFASSLRSIASSFHSLKQLARPGAALFPTLRQRTENLAGVSRRFHQLCELSASERTDFLPFALHISI